MIFNLAIQLDRDDAASTFENVDVRWGDYEDGGHFATARDASGVEVARMGTWDDYPIEIQEVRIVIDGVIGANREYGTWVLTRAESK
jgi:hypothetical protein